MPAADVPEGLSQVVEGMTSGSVRLAVLPPSLGFGDKSVAMPDGVRVPPNAKLYYEVELLRCEVRGLDLYVIMIIVTVQLLLIGSELASTAHMGL